MYSGLMHPESRSLRVVGDSTAIVRCGDHGDAGHLNGCCRYCGSRTVHAVPNQRLTAALDKLDTHYAEAVRWARYRCQQGGLTHAEWEFCKVILDLAMAQNQERHTIENGGFA